MSLPAISPSKSPVSQAEDERLFKQQERGKSPSPTPFSRGFDSEVHTQQPKYMTGYGGFQPTPEEEETTLPKLIVAPVVGYSGYYRGKMIGKLGRCEVHKSRLSSWEKDTVSSILGVPTGRDDWEFSHYTNTCTNFADKRFHEYPQSPLGSSCLSPSSVDGNSGTGGDFEASSSGRSMSPSMFNSQFQSMRLHDQQINGVVTELDKVFQKIQCCLETQFKTVGQARSTLKALFFSVDRNKTNSIPIAAFFELLHKAAGVSLTPPEYACVAHALSSSVEAEFEEDGSEYVVRSINYGRFLNILVPRPGRPSHGSGGSEC
jgi:hypothetical protein